MPSLRAVAASVYANPGVRSAIPLKLGLALSDRRAAGRVRRDSGEYQAMKAFMRELLRETDRAGEADALAAKWLRQTGRSLEVFWRPKLVRQAHLPDLTHYHAAQAKGRGVVVVFGHIGVFHALQYVLNEVNDTNLTIIGPEYRDPPGGMAGRGLAQGLEYIEIIGSENVLIPPGVFKPCAKALAAGGNVTVGFDVPGETPTRFLGRDILLADGAAQMAHATNSVVLPIGGTLDDQMRPTYFCRPPIDSAECADAAEVHQRLADAFADIVLSAPENVWPMGDPPSLAPGLEAAPVATAG